MMSLARWQDWCIVEVSQAGKEHDERRHSQDPLGALSTARRDE
jgi:hypothetical protein